jgi:hypothetical protein
MQFSNTASKAINNFSQPRRVARELPIEASDAYIVVGDGGPSKYYPA